ncbi:hypothetical protein Tsubulata_019737 [Turnera subulata]|uniref:F-box domain-containing protein n=1 Tax=Turnera subulata TaxID=218843 RepID=A0A9Q0JE43_9ROSI|nr:hypothetical protein Tsubulata_019737 [Turnera subulata]
MPRIKCLELEYTQARLKMFDAKYGGALDGLLWICHPESVLASFLPLDFHCFTNLLIKDFSKELSMFIRKREDCCKSARIKCWRHDLKSFQDMNSIMKRSSRTSEDRLSKLPEEIKHTILSFLPTEADRICLSVVSKTWHTSWTSFPFLQLSESLFGLAQLQIRGMEEEGIKYRRQKFINFAEDSLKKKTCLSVFELSVTFYSDTTLVDEINGWITKALQEHGVKELNLQFLEKYDWPLGIIQGIDFFSAEKLTILKVARCSFVPPLPYGNVSWPSLKVLHLSKVTFRGGQFFNGLAKGCPLIEDIALNRCRFDQEVLRVSGFTRLVQVELLQPVGVERIEVNNVPKLLMFSLAEFHSNGVGGEVFWPKNCCKQVVIGANTNLEVLKLSSSSVSPEVCVDISSKFPALKVLHLMLYSLDRIQISSPQLEELALGSSSNVIAIVDAPKLKSLEHWAPNTIVVPEAPRNIAVLRKIPNVTIKGRHSLHNLQLLGFRVYELGVSDLFKLREYLADFKQIEHLKMSSYDECEGEPWKKSLELGSCDIVPIPAMPRIKCLELGYTHARLKMFDAKYGGALDGLLWICHPESVLVCFKPMNLGYFTNLLIKAFCEELSMFIRKRKDCCKSARIKCWRHDLKSFQASTSSSRKPTKRCSSIDLKPLLVDASFSVLSGSGRHRGFEEAARGEGSGWSRAGATELLLGEGLAAATPDLAAGEGGGSSAVLVLEVGDEGTVDDGAGGVWGRT